MRQLSLLFCLLCLAALGNSQTKDSLNLDFEKVKKGTPAGWEIYGGGKGYELALDSVIKKSGKYSVSISYEGDEPNFKAWAFTLPDNYPGKKITLTGWVKTESARDGWAGLWMRIDPRISFENMQKRGIKGTTDWKKYEITLDMSPQKTKQIVIGGLLAGKGKAWFDDFSIAIDGKDIASIKPIPKIIFKAELDKAFDSSSGIQQISLTKEKIADLKTLGLLWGFLKYYHPNIAKGDYNWDYELFRIVPKVLATQNTSERDEVLATWIDQLDSFDTTDVEMKQDSTVFIQPALDWITNSGFSRELTDRLQRLKSAKRSGGSYYIEATFAGNANFKNENGYAYMTYPDAGYRLLSLYRFWNAAEYFFPYKYLIGRDWTSVLEEYIPKILKAKDSINYMLTCLKLIGEVHDTHANIWGNNPIRDRFFGINIAGPRLMFIDQRPVVTGFYNEQEGAGTGLRPGDVITRVNGRFIQNIIDTSLQYTPASNFPTQLRDIAERLLRSNDSTIDVEFERNGRISKKSLRTYPLNKMNIREDDQADTSFKMMEGGIAYINNGLLKRADLPKIWKQLKNAKGLVIDDRNYPSDFPIYDLSYYLMPEKTPFVQFTRPDLSMPGRFLLVPPYTVGKKNPNYFQGRVAILVNEVSVSSAEFHAMAYRQHPNSKVIGSTTAGADGNVSPFYLPGGIYTMFSGLGVYYPDGGETQRIGIIPDIEVRPTIKGISEGRDEVLETALKYINQGG